MVYVIDGYRCYFYQANQGNCSEKLHIHHLTYRSKEGNKRSLRTQRYPIQHNDIIEYDGKVYPSKGTHCKGSRVTAFVGDKIVSLSIKKVKCLFHQKSLFVI